MQELDLTTPPNQNLHFNQTLGSHVHTSFCEALVLYGEQFGQRQFGELRQEGHS